MASPAEMRRVEQHIGACDVCRDAVRWMQATRLVISERPVVVPPADMRLRIARAIASASPTSVPVFPTRRPLVLRPAVWAAAASLAIVGLVAESLTKPQPPAHLLAPTVIAGSSNSRSTPKMHPAPAKLLAQNTPSPIKRSVHSGTSILVAIQNPSSPAAGYAPMRAVEPNSNKTVRLANAAPPVRPVPLTLKSAAPVPPPMLANNGEDTTTIVKTNQEPKSVIVVVNPQSAPAQQTPSITTPVVVAPAPSAPVVEANNDVSQPSLSRPIHADLLSAVKMRVASLNGVSMSKKVYRDTNARVQPAAYDVGGDTGKFVQQPIAYSDGFYPKQ